MISRARKRGFTLLELVIVVAIIMVVSAMATPRILATVSIYRLRSSASGLAALFQKTRMQAVSDDRWSTVAKAGDGTYAWSDLWSDLNTPPDGTFDPDKENQLIVHLPRGITIETAGAPGDISAKLDFIPAFTVPAFNARGLPCTIIGGVCPSQSALAAGGGASGYACYLRQERSLGAPNWAAVTVSPAGRVRVWIWDGSAWN